MNLLVTGGAGFIGSHFVLRHVMRHPNDRVVVLDKLTYAADLAHLESARNRFLFVQGDIADSMLVPSLLTKHDINAIVNFAAESHVDRSIADAAPFLRANVMGVQNLLEACRARPRALLLHVSTDEVYGGLSDHDPPRAVDDPLRPSSPYAASKAAGDLLVLAAIRTHGVRARITRCTNNYGPRQAAEKFIPTVIRHARRNQPVPIYGNGKNRRDWLYVTDHTDAIERVLSDGIDGRTYHVAANEERANLDVARALLELLGKPSSLLTFVDDRPGHDWRYALDTSSMATLGWTQRISFDEGLRRTVESYGPAGELR